MKLKLSDIFIGERHRTDFGDIDALMASIEKVGLLQPIVVSSEYQLVAGRRRHEAYKRLGRSEIEATVAETLDDVHLALLAERDENTCRKDFTPTEAVLMAAAIRPYEEKAADGRRKDHAGTAPGKPSNTPEKFSRVNGRARDKVAEAVGMSRPTLDKAKKVVDAAKADPEHYGDLPKKMDEKGKVDPVFNEMVRRAEQFPIPDGPTPSQIAKSHPAVKWAKNVHECWVVMNSIREHGLLSKIALSWTQDQIKNEIAELREFTRVAGECITELEKLCLKKKSA